MDQPTPGSPFPAPGDEDGQGNIPPADMPLRETPAIVIDESALPSQDPTAAEALSLFQRGFYAEALDKYLEARKKDPTDDRLRKNVALCYLAIGWEALNKR